MPRDRDDGSWTAAPAEAAARGGANLPGGASRQDLTPRQRELQRLVMRALPALQRLDGRRREFVRRLRGAPHVVEFFHQVDDPYSHLALAAIPRLEQHHSIRFRFHLVSRTDRLHAPEPERLAAHARRDCSQIASHYGLDFPRDAAPPADDDVRHVERLLAPRLGAPDFLERALAVGRALWWGERPNVDPGDGSSSDAAAREAERALAAGNARRTRLGHYSGGMFWYAGEWYWGVDRLHHLERRLGALGARRSTDGSPGTSTLDTSAGPARGARVPAEPCFPRPPLDPGPVRDAGRLALEIFPSLRSPYTAIVFERSLALARAANVRVVLRPVMPMVMRGVPAPAAKGIYIFLDAKREADVLGVPFGNMYDPIGSAVLRGFSLWPFARERGREAEYIAAFLRAAFVEGRPTGTDAGLRRVVESAGLDWTEALPFVDSTDFEAELERNRRILYDELGLWGVPSFRLRGPVGVPDLCVWGQDRLWLVAAEIRRRLARSS